MGIIMCCLIFLFFWCLWQLSWRTLAWVFSPLAEYVDEKDKAEREYRVRIEGKIEKLKKVQVYIPVLEATEYDLRDKHLTCRHCGAELSDGDVESYFHGEADYVKCTLCEAKLREEDFN